MEFPEGARVSEKAFDELRQVQERNALQLDVENMALLGLLGALRRL